MNDKIDIYVNEDVIVSWVTVGDEDKKAASAKACAKELFKA